MTIFAEGKGAPLGSGSFLPAGSVLDPDLASSCANYKRTIASRYVSRGPDEIDELPSGGLYVSPKIDGEMWFLLLGKDGPALIAPNGKVITGNVPVLEEAAKIAQSRVRGRTLLAGELFAVRKGGRPRVGDLAAAFSGGVSAEVDRIGFHAYDLLEGGDAESPEAMPEYGDRLATLRRLLDGGKRLQCIRTEEVSGAAEVKRYFEEWAEGGKGEGIVVRSKDFGRIYKVKPFFTLDAAVVGYTVRTDIATQVRSLLLALQNEDGQFQIIGSCGNLGEDSVRSEFFAELSTDVIPSNYSHASSSGAMFRFVQPKLVVEIRVTDLQSEESDGKPVRRMVLQLREGPEKRFSSVAATPGISILHPVLVRRRTDKSVNPTDVRLAQVLERAAVTDLGQAAHSIELPKSEIVKRRVFVKTTKGKQAVRKLLVWKTNKELVDASYPAFVVHFTDYSSGRKEPLDREVKRASTLDVAESIAEAMIAEGVKTGWKEA